MLVTLTNLRQLIFASALFFFRLRARIYPRLSLKLMLLETASLARAFFIPVAPRFIKSHSNAASLEHNATRRALSSEYRIPAARMQIRYDMRCMRNSFQAHDSTS